MVSGSGVATGALELGSWALSKVARFGAAGAFWCSKLEATLAGAFGSAGLGVFGPVSAIAFGTAASRGKELPYGFNNAPGARLASLAGPETDNAFFAASYSSLVALMTPPVRLAAKLSRAAIKSLFSGVSSRTSPPVLSPRSSNSIFRPLRLRLFDSISLRKNLFVVVSIACWGRPLENHCLVYELSSGKSNRLLAPRLIVAFVIRQ